MTARSLESIRRNCHLRLHSTTNQWDDNRAESIGFQYNFWSMSTLVVATALGLIQSQQALIEQEKVLKDALTLFIWSPTSGHILRCAFHFTCVIYVCRLLSISTHMNPIKTCVSRERYMSPGSAGKLIRACPRWSHAFSNHNISSGTLQEGPAPRPINLRGF